MNIKRILIPLLSILFMASMIAFGAPVYVNIGPTSEIDGDIKILSEIVAEGTTADGWETTIFFTDPTADRTITIPDFDVTAGTAIYLTVTDNENTNETNAVLFTSGGALGGGASLLVWVEFFIFPLVFPSFSGSGFFIILFYLFISCFADFFTFDKINY